LAASASEAAESINTAGGCSLSEHSDLRQKIDEAKGRLLPMPELLPRLGLSEHAKKSARCPFHSDEHNSFSVFQKNDGTWWHRCFVGCSEGDEISLLRKLKGLSAPKAISLYLEMAGFPPTRSRKSQ
jgi:CHC2 zinc finger